MIQGDQKAEKVPYFTENNIVTGNSGPFFMPPPFSIRGGGI